MKKYITGILLLFSGNLVFAIFVNKFTSWSELIDQSPDIIIAECTGSPNATAGKPYVINDGLVPSDIDVISVLKGNTRLGPSKLSSQYWPHQGERFLLLSNYREDQYATNYVATEDYRVVPINYYFRTNQISGKTLNAQIQWILKNRLNDLNDELKKGNEEKLRLEEGLATSVDDAGKSNIVPPKVPTPSLHGNGVPF